MVLHGRLYIFIIFFSKHGLWYGGSECNNFIILHKGAVCPMMAVTSYLVVKVRHTRLAYSSLK